MTDEKLLTLAAKAAGIKVHKASEHGLFLKSAVWWNPLTDDGDALRLAVKLNLLFTLSPRLMHFLVLERFSRQGDNDCMATRRAIVRAAAQIGAASE